MTNEQASQTQQPLGRDTTPEHSARSNKPACPTCGVHGSVVFVQYTRIDYKAVRLDEQQRTVDIDNEPSIDYGSVRDQFVYCSACGHQLKNWTHRFV